MFKDSYGYYRIGWVITFAALLLAAVIFAICSGINEASAKSCRDTGKKMELEADYGWWTGCLYKVNGQWIDSDMIRVTDTGAVVISDEE